MTAPPVAIPDDTTALTVSLTCVHSITCRYEPEAPQGSARCLDIAADALRYGWAVEDRDGAAREGWLYARDGDGRPVASWLVPNLTAWEWLRPRLGLRSVTKRCERCGGAR